MIYKFLQAVLLSAICLAVNAQSLQSWTWDYYKMKFKAPDNMVVQKSDETVYEAYSIIITNRHPANFLFGIYTGRFYY
ncbi:MAG: hypothetical protein ABI863_12600 [Ginsengibacter sp.]